MSEWRRTIRLVENRAWMAALILCGAVLLWLCLILWVHLTGWLLG